MDGHRSDLYTISSPAANSHLLLIFSYSLNPDQARQNIGPDLDPKCFTLHVPAERFLENFILNKSTDDKNHEKLLSKLISLCSVLTTLTYKTIN